MMRELSLRILRRSLPVMLVLGVMGYIFGEAYLVLTRMNGGIADPANDVVRWRAPFTMAGFGLGIMVLVETLGFFLRHKQPPASPTLDDHAIPPQKPGASP
jgi:hypothetical protein